METVQTQQVAQSAAEELPQEEFYKKYPNVFDNFPPKYKEIIYNYITSGKYKQSMVHLEPLENLVLDTDQAKKQGNIFAWAAIANYVDLFMYLYEGYIQFADRDKKLMKGERVTNINLLDVLKYAKNEASCQRHFNMSCGETQKILTGLYKIHLMPKYDDLNTVITMFTQRLQQDPALQNSLESFKIVQNKHINDVVLKTGNGEIMPLVVLYPATGKENAQKVLNIIADIYKDRKGLDITPRYNRKITSLIYYAQGDADQKKSTTAKHFEPGFVHYISRDPKKHPLQNPFEVTQTEEPKSPQESHKRKKPETTEAEEKPGELKSVKA